MKRLKVQRRGKGSPRYIARTDSIDKAKYPFNFSQEKMHGEIVGLIHNRGKSAPLVKIALENGVNFYLPASEGTYVGQKIQVGAGSELSLGSVLLIGDVLPGMPIYNIENHPGDGGQFFRAGGSFGEVISVENDVVYVKMKSGEKKKFDPKNLCTVGIVAGGGRVIKPFYKAGAKSHLMKAKGGRIYPRVRGYAMNTVDHPHGGSGHNSAGRQKMASKKFGPPGTKVGHFGGKRTGRKKK